MYRMRETLIICMNDFSTQLNFSNFVYISNITSMYVPIASFTSKEFEKHFNTNIQDAIEFVREPTNNILTHSILLNNMQGELINLID